MAEDHQAYDAREFPPRAVTVDITVFAVADGRLLVLMLERDREEEWFPGKLALPGSFVRDDENLREAAVRVLWEKAGLDLPMHTLEQFGAYGDPDRDPRMRVISIGFMGLIDNAAVEESDDEQWFLPRSDSVPPGSDRRRRWIPVDTLIDAGSASVAFDHLRILEEARDRLRVRVEETDAALDLLDEPFTLPQLREVYEAIWGMRIDPGNFAKRVGRMEGFIESVESPGVSATTESSTSSIIESPALLRSFRLSSPGEPMLEVDSLRSMQMSMPPSSSEEESTPSRPRGRPPKWYVRGGAQRLHPPLRRPGSYFLKPRRSPSS